MRFFVSRCLRRRLLSVTLGAVSVATSGCAREANSTDSATADVAAVVTRLQGSWQLAGFTPDIALEPMLAMWLAGAQRSLVVRFDGGSLQADTPAQAFAFHYDRPFTVTNVAGNNFTLTTVTQSGEPLVSYCQLDPSGQRLQFHSQTEPFRGSGVLARAGAPAGG